MSEGRPIAQAWGGITLAHDYFAVSEPRSTIILLPTVMGITALERDFAAMLNAKGHGVLVADLYGQRFAPDQRDQAMAAMHALRGDRAALRDLLLAVADVARAIDGVDPAKIIVIGFCFGGQCALDLARSGAAIAGVASFHGLFDPPDLPPRPITARVIAFHGWDDPLAKPETVVALAAELTAARCDWQIVAMGDVGHAFTNPGATGAMPGILYDERAARRAWAGLDQFLADLLD